MCDIGLQSEGSGFWPKPRVLSARYRGFIIMEIKIGHELELEIILQFYNFEVIELLFNWYFR